MLHVNPVTPRFGAEISGVDLTRPIGAALRDGIIAAQQRWGITIWRDTGLDDATHVAFSRLFGHLEKAPYPPGAKRRCSLPELFDASNLDVEGKIADSEERRTMRKGDKLWHSDSSFMPLRTAYSLLLCHEAPPIDGPTWFADTRSAWEDLPQPMKDRIDGLSAVHSYYWSRRRAGYEISEEEIDARPSATHPLVHGHRGSGRKALYVGAHARDIVGMPRDEGRALLRELYDWATQPQYIFSVVYRPGDMVIWDNLASMHRAGDYDDTRYRRDMRRTTVREAPAPELPDDPFAEAFAPLMQGAR